MGAKLDHANYPWGWDANYLTPWTIDFFTTLFDAQLRPLLTVGMNFTVRLTEEMNAWLRSPPHMEGVKYMLWSLPLNKSSGPNGIPLEIFRAHCVTILEGVRAAILHFFLNMHMLTEFNHTYITLIPKKQAPITLSNYHPISCVGTIYKVIAKLLATRLACV